MDIIDKLLAACVGHPVTNIPWPHRVLHDAAEEITRLRAELADLKSCACSDCNQEVLQLRAELAEARTVKESLIVALDLFGRHSPKGKPCPVCEAIDAAMAGGENEPYV